MNRPGRSQLALGVILILLGAWFLLDRINPGFHSLVAQFTEWPVNLILIGALLLLFGIFMGNPGLAVPAVIVAGLGGIFLYQKATDNYNSWPYMWTLILGFIGLGSVLAGLLGDNRAHNVRRGFNLMVTSAVLFLIFASIFGGLSLLGTYGPAILLIILGVWILGRGIYRSYRYKGE